MFSNTKNFDLKKTSQIVIPKYNTSYLTVLALNELISEIKRINNGIADNVVKDNNQISEFEILIGRTNRTKTERIVLTDKYIITLQDEKLIVDGGSVKAINYAISILKDKICAGDYIISETIEGICEVAVSVAGYNNTITDEFDGDTLSKIWTKWDKTYAPEVYKKSDGTLTFLNLRDENNITVSDGMLTESAYLGEKIIAENGTATQKVYTAKMDTRNDFWFRYGYVEFSAKAVAGEGLGCTVWLHGDNRKVGNLYCEYDFPEFYGNTKVYRACPLAWKVGEIDGVRKSLAGVYFGGHKMREAHYYNLDNMEDFANEFHTYGLEWDEDYYKFIVDGEIIFDIRYSDITDETKESKWLTAEEIVEAYRQPCYAVISIKAGTFSWALPTYWPDRLEYAPDAEKIFDKKFDGTDNTLKVDYFTVYQKEGQLSATTADEFYEKVNK